MCFLFFCLFSFVITQQHISHTNISPLNTITFEQEICVNICCGSGAGAAAVAAAQGRQQQQHRRSGTAAQGWQHLRRRIGASAH